MVVREPRVRPPTLENYSDLPLFNTKAVVHQTGVPAPTLRAWERRYGILSPRRSENDYRLYSERDMATVTWLRERVESGMTISQAIALLRSLEPTRRKGRRSRWQANAEIAEAPEATELPTASAPAATPSFSMQNLSAALVRQFVNLDEFSAQRTIAQALAVYPMEDVCLSIFGPALEEIGRRWAAHEVSVTVEHFGSALIRAQLESLFRMSALAQAGPLVLVGCAPGELHELGALMLALFLRRVGLRVVYLGQNIEIESLISTTETVQPAAVLLSALLPSHIAAIEEVAERMQQHPQAQVSLFFGGQAFATAAERAQHIPGQLLLMDAHSAALEVRRRLLP